MGDFSTVWLQLREPVDRRSRATAIADALRDAFLTHRVARVIDIGCGTGANLRATAPLLGAEQEWTLLDNDPALLEAARDILAAWADHSELNPDGLRLRKDGRTIRVRFRLYDLAADPGGSIEDGADLVTASAFFDLVSPAFIDRLVSAVVRQKAAFHTVQTYDGTHRWSPESAFDGAIGRAFNMHQTADKGFGLAAGPGASALLRQAFQAAGYATRLSPSPWVLAADDSALIVELVDGIAAAVAETGQVSADAIMAWRTLSRQAARVGHDDFLALPAGWPKGDPSA